MNVADLREALADLPDEMPVLLSTDGEGNSFRDLSDVQPEKAYDDGWEWEIRHPDDLAEYSQEELAELTDAVVLWPVG